MRRQRCTDSPLRCRSNATEADLRKANYLVSKSACRFTSSEIFSTSRMRNFECMLNEATSKCGILHPPFHSTASVWIQYEFTILDRRDFESLRTVWGINMSSFCAFSAMIYFWTSYPGIRWAQSWTYFSLIFYFLTNFPEVWNFEFLSVVS